MGPRSLFDMRQNSISILNFAVSKIIGQFPLFLFDKPMSRIGPRNPLFDLKQNSGIYIGLCIELKYLIVFHLSYLINQCVSRVGPL